MKQPYLFFCLLGVLVISCKRPVYHYLKPQSLPSSFISIRENQAVNMRTPNGAVIKIASGTFNVPVGTMVDIEIKEAYSFRDMLQAGLTTVSNGRLLQSGGMIYFNASQKNNAVAFKKPVEITIPSAVYNENMQLFKGEYNSDSTINWGQPAALDTSVPRQDYLHGQQLFRGNCASCHRETENYTGPMLAGARLRAPYISWPYRFINHTTQFILTDTYARKLQSQYGGVVMTSFNLPARDIKAIFDYCDNVALSQNPDFFKGFINKSDSIENAQDTLFNCGMDTLPLYPGNTFDTSFADTASQYLFDDTTVAALPDVAMSPIYEFNIDRSGWYNIDCFININNTKVKPVKLLAGISGVPGDVSLDVLLCIPSRMLMADGIANGDSYYFGDNSNGDLLLIPGDRAFIMVLAKSEDKYYYAIQPFVVKKEQQLKLTLKEASKETINDMLHKNKLDSVQLDPRLPVPVEIINLNDSNTVDGLKQVVRVPCI